MADGTPFTQSEAYLGLMAEQQAIEEPPQPSRYRVLKRLASNPDNHFVVSFGGGSVPGLAGNAALATLMEELELLDHLREVWGTSAGSIVGGLWASGCAGRDCLDTVESMRDVKAIDIPFWDVFMRGGWRLATKKELPEGLIRGQEFRNALRRDLLSDRFEDARFPLRILAVSDDGHARKIVFRDGSIEHACMASMCLPGISYPVLDEGGFLHLLETGELPDGMADDQGSGSDE